MRHYSNTAQEAALVGGITGSSTSITVDGTSGFPASTPYTLVLDPEETGEELVEVTAVSGTTLTVTRGADGTPAGAHDGGATVRHVHSAQDFREAQEHIADTSAVHGVTGSVVGTTDIQTLTNKNLADPSNTLPADVVRDADITDVVRDADITDVVRTSGAQAVTDKDLSSGTNTFPSSLATDSDVNTAAFGGSARTVRPHAHIGRSATLLVATGGSASQVPMPTVVEESDASFTAASGGGLVAPISGLYLISASVGYQTLNLFARRVDCQVLVNGALTLLDRKSNVGQSSAEGNCIVGIRGAVLRLAAGDAITVATFQDSSGNQTIDPNPAQTYLTATWLAP